MALVTHIENGTLEKDVPHSAVRCTFTVVSDANGDECLQLDTYGSATRKIPDKKSQSLRFSKAALLELKHILATKFPAL
jgi:hypothetical protein